MRYVTTLTLLAATGMLGLAWSWQAHREAETGIGTTDELARITAADLTRIEVADARLEKTDNVWKLVGGWPTRSAAVADLVDALTNLHTRFAPVTPAKLDDVGLGPDQKPLVVRVGVRMAGGGEKTYTLTFGEPPATGDNPFVRPTYLRVDDRPEVLRLAPGLTRRLAVSRTDFLRKQLFPDVVRVKLQDSGTGELPPPPVPLLDAESVIVTGPEGTIELRRTSPAKPRTDPTPITQSGEAVAANWELTSPVTDRVDPEKLRGMLAAVPELWVESFLPAEDPTKTGLDAPERTVAVKSAAGDLKLIIGKVSRVVESKAPAPPPANPFAPPPPPPPPSREEFRYAKLPGNEQLFEVKASRFAELFVKPADLRDPKVVRFKPAEVKSIDIVAKDLKLSFVREKDAAGDDRWKMLEPAGPAEASKVSELLDKLDNLQVRGPDVTDPTDRKPLGLADDDTATTVTLGFADDAQPKSLQIRLGKDDPTKSKVPLQIAGRSRVNLVPDDLIKLVARPALAYRSRRVIDFAPRTVTKITIDRPTDAYSLVPADGGWSLATPVATKADPGKANALLGDLCRLDAVDFVNFAPSAEDLKNYGLEPPALTATLVGESTKSVQFGRARDGKPEVYARIAGSPEVFAVRASVKETIDQPSLAMRPLQLWIAPGAIVSKIALQRDATGFELTRDGASWKIAGPFAASAFLPTVQPLLDASSGPRAEKFVAHTSEDLAGYGLDKPAATLSVTLNPERPDDPRGTRTIQFGKPVAEGQAARFARMADQPGVFVFAAGDLINTSPLDLLDRRLLQLDARQIQSIRGEGATGNWTVRRDAGAWSLASFTPPVAGDRATLDRLVNVFADLRASKFVAYAPADLAPFGLDKPTSTFTLSLGLGEKPVTHTIVLGGSVPDNPQARYVRVDDIPAIGILPLLPSMELAVTGLDLADRAIVSFPVNDLLTIRRTGEPGDLTIEKRDGIWTLTKPADAPADEPLLGDIIERLANLRAVKVAGLGVKDFKPFGLDPPVATLTLAVRETDGKTRDIVLSLGNPTANGRPARLGTSDTVYLLAESANDPLAKRLTAPALKFRDRTLGRFTDADRVVIRRDDRTLTFAKVDGAWKLTAPLTGDAEAFDLDDLILVGSKLRCEELLADATPDLKALGLEKPLATIDYFLGDKEVGKIAVSAKDAEGRAVARFGESPLVGRLDPQVAQRLLNEFRKRSLWNNVDVAQADTLIVNSGTGGTPTILNRTQEGWQLSGEAAKTVDSAAVTDLLAAFAGLKVERYVVDQKAEVKLYGLDPAVRVIAVKTRDAEPVTLHIGRFEGDSKRAYATVPGSGVVVLLSEADSAKLLRPLTK